MAEEVLIKVEVIDQASKQMDQIGKNISSSAASAQRSMLEFSSQATIASVGLAAALAKVGTEVVMAGANLQQAGYAFESLTGSAEESAKMMKFLTDLAIEAPLDMEQTVEGTRRLLAYGMSAEKVREVFPGLVDAVSALGVEGGRLNKVTLAMGQIFNSATVKGSELRQLTEAGVPVYDMLAKAIQNGSIQVDGLSKGMTTLGGASKKQSDANIKATESMGILNAQIKVMEQNLDKARSSGKKSGEQIALMEAQLNAKKSKLGEASSAINDYAKANENAGKKVSFAGASLEEIKSQLVNVADLQIDGKQAAEALFEAFGEKYAGAAEKQMESFSAQLSNTRDIFQMTSARILGWTEEGVRAGSILDKLTTGLTWFNNALNNVSPQLVKFADFIMENKIAMGIFAGVMTSLLLPAFALVLGPIAALISAAAPFVPLLVGAGIAIGGLSTILDNTNFKKTSDDLESASKNTSNWYDGLGEVNPELEKMEKHIIFLNGSGGIADLDQNMSRFATREEVRDSLSEWEKSLKSMKDSISVIDFGPLTSALDNILGRFNISGDFFSGIGPALTKFVDAFIFSFAAIINVVLPNFILGIDAFFLDLQMKAEQFKNIFTDNDLGVETAKARLKANTDEMSINIDTFQASLLYKEGFTSEQLANIYTLRGTNLSLSSQATADQLSVINTNMSLDTTTKFGQMSTDSTNKVVELKNNTTSNFKNISTTAATESATMMTNYSTGLQSKMPEVESQISSMENTATSGLERMSAKSGEEGKNFVSRWIDGIKSAAAGLGKFSGEFFKSFGMDGMAHGGIVPGPIDAPVPIMAHGGERIVPRTGVDVNDTGSTGGITINFNGNVSMDNDQRMQELTNMINSALGRQNEMARMGVGY